MRALVSVHDKTGIVELARSLAGSGYEMIASGGTARAISEAGIACTPVEQVTMAPEMLSGRVKTLHPAIAAGILADRSDPEHMAEMERHSISPIDLVVANFYPFSSNPSVELIDVGGPTMARSAAKNHAHTGVVVDPGDYAWVAGEIAASESKALSRQSRARLAAKAFAHVSAYDAEVAAWLAGAAPAAGPAEEVLPGRIVVELERAELLRYGENPHQLAARYRTRRFSPGAAPSWAPPPGIWDRAIRHGGLEMSYLNLLDAEAAWRLLSEIAGPPVPAAVIVKHANPCGVAVAADLAKAYERAFECDPISAFGGIVAVNGLVDDEVAEAVVSNARADVLLAPGYSPAALELFARRRKSMRVVELPAAGPGTGGAPAGGALELRPVDGGYLVQQPDSFGAAASKWRIATKVQPPQGAMADAALAWTVCAYVKSNAIVLVHAGQAVGIGAGQPSRVGSAEIAVAKAAGRARGGVAASDAFFPFPDGPEALAAAGVSTIVQPGGSVRDSEVLDACDALGVAMLMTGERHFRH
ncbi:MAG: bifunctional phosphoribosylaminoimidazolecarboxamide formyltransferase/IMP cyclohydrolase [Acidimicrobiales bacterium]